MQTSDLPNYAPNPKHRNARSTDAQWTILPEEEHTSFIEAWVRGWCPDDKGWGLHRIGTDVAKLGGTASPQENAFIAKFVSSAQPIQWHGYPADRRKNQDIPPREILVMWMT